ncbi:MAG: hypothetical protein ABJF10_30060 [Chthoniobacter sp.]|uniref:hypothetical protein n=1 Tax=Chthoniobacter sp. TaxID=2510640 RepID=UPI0032AD3A77
MKTEKHLSSTDKGLELERKAKRPALVTYGSATKLTKGKSGRSSESQGTKP